MIQWYVCCRKIDNPDCADSGPYRRKADAVKELFRLMELHPDATIKLIRHDMQTDKYTYDQIQ